MDSTSSKNLSTKEHKEYAKIYLGTYFKCVAFDRIDDTYLSYLPCKSHLNKFEHHYNEYKKGDKK